LNGFALTETIFERNNAGCRIVSLVYQDALSYIGHDIEEAVEEYKAETGCLPTNYG
jgi:hypothetical protein